MKKDRWKHVLAVIFSIYVLVVGFAFRDKPGRIIKEFSATGSHNVDYFLYMVESEYKRNIPTMGPLLANKTVYVDFAGLMARMLGNRDYNGAVKLDNGFVVLEERIIASDSEAVKRNAASTQLLYNEIKDRGAEFVFVLAPSVVNKWDPQLPPGFENGVNESADLFISELKKLGVPYLDLRDKMREQGISQTEAFYRTDHHWVPRTAHWASTEIYRYLHDRGVVGEVDEMYLDYNSYTEEVRPGWHLGSAGRHVGRYYTEPDDMQIVYPKFHTHLRMEYEDGTLMKEGEYKYVMLKRKMIDYYDPLNNYYYDNLYMRDAQPFNLYSETAQLTPKLAWIKDSFGRSMTGFMATYFKDMHVIQFLEDSDLDWDRIDPDIVFVMYTAYHVGDESRFAFSE